MMTLSILWVFPLLRSGLLFLTFVMTLIWRWCSIGCGTGLYQRVVSPVFSFWVWCVTISVAEFSFSWWCSDLWLMWSVFECVCYGNQLTRLVCVEVSGRLLSRCKVDVRGVRSNRIRKLLACRVVKSWFLITNGGWYRLAGHRRQR